METKIIEEKNSILKMQEEMKNNVEAEQMTIEDDLDNEIDLWARLADVRHRIRSKIGGDFVLAKMEDRYNKGTIELLGLADYSQSLIDQAGIKTKKWKWNNDKKRWEKHELSEKEIKKLIRLSQIAFDTLMNPMNARAILSRNKKDNWLVGALVEKRTKDTGIITPINDGLTAMKKEEEVK